jgi:SAM-dependent methyltransferase
MLEILHPAPDLETPVVEPRSECGVAPAALPTCADVTADTLPGDTAPDSSTRFDRAYFSSIYRAIDDPWGLSGHYYEHRKRSILMASLPRESFRRAFEPGCATGELSVLLAARCERLVASDFVSEALLAARGRLGGHRHVSVEDIALPEQWPEGTFDLIVVSELAYYLDDAALDSLALKARGSLDNDGVLVACHWKHAIEDAHHDAHTVHARLAASMNLIQAVHHEEADFLLDIWCCDPRSVAATEGIL